LNLREALDRARRDLGARALRSLPDGLLSEATIIPVSEDGLLDLAAGMAGKGPVLLDLVSPPVRSAGPGYVAIAPDDSYPVLDGQPVAVAATAADAYRLCVDLARSGGGVLLVHPTAPPGPDPAATTPLGHAVEVRPGDSCTLVSWGRALDATLAAADRLAGAGVSAKVLDARGRPLPVETCIAALKETHRLFVTADGPWAHELVARVLAGAFDYLDEAVLVLTPEAAIEHLLTHR
jgi:hypothetical protein